MFGDGVLLFCILQVFEADSAGKRDDNRKVVYVARGKGSDTFTHFKEEYLKKGGKQGDIKAVIMDMSPAFIKGAKETFPKAQIVFDKFHVMKILNEQLDLVRKREQKSFGSFFKKTRYLFLKSEKNLTKAQKEKLGTLLEERISGICLQIPLEFRRNSTDTIKAYNLIQSFKELFDYSRPSAAGRFLTGWVELCKVSKIPEMISAAKTVFNHIEGILQHIRTKKTNAMLEGFNSKLRVLTKRAYGFKRFDYMRTIIFMNLGKLNFSIT
jgi:transposase